MEEAFIKPQIPYLYVNFEEYKNIVLERLWVRRNQWYWVRSNLESKIRWCFLKGIPIKEIIKNVTG